MLGARNIVGAGDRTGTGVGTAATVVRTVAGRVAGGALYRTTCGPGGTTESGAGTGARCITASCFTITGVPGGEALKKVSAIPLGRRMQPCEAA